MSKPTKSKGKSKGKQGKKKTELPVAEPTAAFHLILPGGRDYGLDTMSDLAAEVRRYHRQVPGGQYVATDAYANPVHFDPYDFIKPQDVVAEMKQQDEMLTELSGQLNNFRALDRQRKNQLIAAGLIPVEVLAGHVHQMTAENAGGMQRFNLTLASFGPLLTEADPLTQALHALTGHLAPEEEPAGDDGLGTVGDPDDAAQVVTDLPNA